MGTRIIGEFWPPFARARMATSGWLTVRPFLDEYPSGWKADDPGPKFGTGPGPLPEPNRVRQIYPTVGSRLLRDLEHRQAAQYASRRQRWRSYMLPSDRSRIFS